MAVTVQQIAEYCGVSRPTVSLILNNRGDRYHPDTRRKVLEAADRLGYVPNGAARALAKQQPTSIGLLTSTEPQLSVVGQIVPGIQRELRHRNLHLTVAELPDQQLTDEGFVPKILREFSVSGFLVGYTHRVPPAMQELIRKHRIPSVWLNARRPADSVYPDDEGAMREATRRIVEAGHRRIAYVSTTLTEHYSQVDRPAGYAAAMADAGLTPRTLLRSDGTQAEAFEALDALLGERERPTALLTYNAEDALAVAYFAARRGLSIPRDLSLVTTGDEVIRVGPLRITTSRVPFPEVGEAAVKMLIERIAAPKAPAESVAIPHELLEPEASIHAPPA